MKNKIYRNIILPIVLYGFETRSVILRERYRLRMFGNRVLRKTFEPKRDEVTDKLSRLHNEKLHYMYSSLNIIRVIKSVTMGGAGDLALRRRGEICVGKYDGKRTLGRCRRRWEDKIKKVSRSGMGTCTGVIWLETGTNGWLCD
jgi:hypothetical protein